MRQVTEEHERRHAARRELGDIFDLDILTLPCWGRIILDDRKHHLVQLGRRDTLGAILVNLLGGLQHLQDTLFRQSGDKQDREVGKRSQTLADSGRVRVDHLLALIFDQVPLIHTNHQSLLILLHQREDIHILALDTPRSVQHQHADIRVLDGADRTDHRVILQVLIHLPLLTDTRRIHQIEVQAEFIIFRVDGITGRACDIGNDMTILANKSIDKRRFSRVRASYNRDTGQLLLQYLHLLLGQRRHDLIQQIPGIRTIDGRDAERISQAKRVKLRRGRMQIIIIRLVRHHDHRPLATTQDLRHLHVQIRDAIQYIDDEQDHVRLLDSHFYLLVDLLLENILRVNHPSACVNQRKLLAGPLHLAVLTVAGSTSLLVHDRLTGTRQPVEKG